MSDADRELDALAQDLARFRAVAAPVVLRSRVRAEILTAPALAAPPARASSWLGALRPLIAAVVIAAVLAAAGGSAVAGSLPGDPAFPVKRAVEEAQVALTIDDAARLDALTVLLDRRLSDLEAVATRKPDALATATAEYEAAIGRVEQQLASVSAQPRTAARDAAISRAAAAAGDHASRLRDLASTLPAAAQPGIQRAIDAHERIEERAGPSVPHPTGEPRASDQPRPSNVPGGTPSARPTTPSRTPDRSAPPTRR